MKLYLLCSTCRRAWLALVAASCCGEIPCVIDPLSSQRSAWFRARLADGWRAAQVSALANLTTTAEMRAMLARGVVRRGRSIGWAS